MATQERLTPPLSPARSNTNPITVHRWILDGQRQHAGATGELSVLLTSLATACKSVSAAVRRAGLTDGLLGASSSSNATGDTQQALDVISNTVFLNLLKGSGACAAIVSEEEDEIVPADAGAHYIVATDPLDGSSNIACNVSVGSIFAVVRREPAAVGSPAAVAECLRPGRELVAAGYAAYGSSTQLVLTLAGAPPALFTLDPAVGEFLLTTQRVVIPAAPQRIYSVNEGNAQSFPPYLTAFLAEAKAGAKPYSARYVGSMVADIHRTLLYGGVYVYPPTPSAPRGKLRLLYECAPMAFIVEAAGGKATAANGQRVLDVAPSAIHDKSPIAIGCARDVDRLEELRVAAERA